MILHWKEPLLDWRINFMKRRYKIWRNFKLTFKNKIKIWEYEKLMIIAHKYIYHKNCIVLTLSLIGIWPASILL
jgi:hypothetical protein